MPREAESVDRIPPGDSMKIGAKPTEKSAQSGTNTIDEIGSLV
jgi:hypothetical protein